MKKHLLKIARTSMLLAVGGLVTGLTSCMNFLSGEGVKKQIEEEIAYANASSYEIRTDCDSSEGTIVSPAITSKKITDEFTVEFKMSADLMFMGWRACTKSADGTLAELSDEYIKFLSYNTESSDGIYKATVKFMRYADNIVIRPVCEPFPAVTDYSPASGETSFANAPVTVTFNVPLDESFFRYEKDFVSISDSGTDVSSLFDSPSIDEAKLRSHCGHLNENCMTTFFQKMRHTLTWRFRSVRKSRSVKLTAEKNSRFHSGRTKNLLLPCGMSQKSKA